MGHVYNVPGTIESCPTYFCLSSKSAGYATSYIGKWGHIPGDPAAASIDDYVHFNGSGALWNKTAGKAEPCRVNGMELKLGDEEYMPDLMHDRVKSFFLANQNKPFFLCYSMVHMHSDIQPTPDSTDLLSDNIRYMDKLVGKLVAAAGRFEKMDTNQDGIVTRGEYVSIGGKKSY